MVTRFAEACGEMLVTEFSACGFFSRRRLRQFFVSMVVCLLEVFRPGCSVLPEYESHTISSSSLFISNFLLDFAAALVCFLFSGSLFGRGSVTPIGVMFVCWNILWRNFFRSSEEISSVIVWRNFFRPLHPPLPLQNLDGSD